MRPESVTWVPSPAAYSSRNAVSLALAAVFLTAAKALGRRSAMRASFMVETCALRSSQDVLARATARVESVLAANLASRQCCAKHLRRSVGGSKRCVSSVNR